jgi:hypothetical protein
VPAAQTMPKKTHRADGIPINRPAGDKAPTTGAIRAENFHRSSLMPHPASNSVKRTSELLAPEPEIRLVATIRGAQRIRSHCSTDSSPPGEQTPSVPTAQSDSRPSKTPPASPTRETPVGDRYKTSLHESPLAARSVAVHQFSYMRRRARALMRNHWRIHTASRKASTKMISVAT